jgi:hypothetical protein
MLERINRAVEQLEQRNDETSAEKTAQEAS